MVAAAALTLAACGSKTDTNTSASSGTTAAATTAAASSSDTAASSADTAAASSADTAASSADTAASSADTAGSSAAETAGSSSGTPSAGGLQIVPQVQIDIEGKEVKSTATGQPADPADGGGKKCANVNLAMVGALSGPNAALGQNILYGANVAIEAHNKANPDCQVTIKSFDTEGDPQKATQVVPTVVADTSVIGVLGPAFSGETGTTGDIFNQANLLSLTASATNPDLTTNGWKTFYRGLANDAVQGPAVAKYMVETLKYKKVCVIQDNSDYGVGLAKTITSGLGSSADAGCSGAVKTGDKDFSATVTKVKSASPDAVFYSGYYAEAAPFVKQLRDGGVTATFVSADGTNDPQFVAQAGEASKDAILSCPCGPAPEAFAKTYAEVNKGAKPGVYSVEGYDLTTIMLKGIDSGITDRAKLVEFVKNYDGQGLARQYKWDDKGELASALIWIYKVQ